MSRPPLPRHSVTQPLDESYRFIALTKGQTVIVDVSDFHWLSKFNWYAQWKPDVKKFYAARKPTSGIVYMHREILSCYPADFADHKDGNSLDNRKYNLRKCSKSQNGFNRGKAKHNVSGFKGVFWNRQKEKWHARITVNHKQIHCGFFEAAERAAHAYDEAAKIHHGAFAHLNFPS